jgi:hypothetical protein
MFGWGINVFRGEYKILIRIDNLSGSNSMKKNQQFNISFLIDLEW